MYLFTKFDFKKCAKFPFEFFCATHRAGLFFA